MVPSLNGIAMEVHSRRRRTKPERIGNVATLTWIELVTRSASSNAS
jgi:hypothetical protein